MRRNRSRLGASLAVLALLVSACGDGDGPQPQPDLQPAPEAERVPDLQPAPDAEPAQPLEQTDSAEPERVAEPGQAETPSSTVSDEFDSAVVDATVPESPDAAAEGVSQESDALDESQIDPREVLAADPVLQWTEFDPVPQGTDFDPDTERLSGLQSSEDGRILVRTWHDEGGRVVVTSDGINWTELPLPEEIEPRHVAASGDRWLLAGTWPSADRFWADTSDDEQRIRLQESFAQRIHPGRAFAQRVFFSDDEGLTWTELDLEVPELATQGPPCVDPAVVYWYPEFGKPNLLTARELLEDETWPQCSVEYSGVQLLSSWAGRIAIVVTRQRGTDMEEVENRLFLSDGSDVELAAEWDQQWIHDAVGSGGGLVLDLDKVLLASSDGRLWNEVPADPSIGTIRLGGSGADGMIWGTARASRGSGGLTIGRGEERTTYEVRRLEYEGSAVVSLGPGKATTPVTVLKGLDIDRDLAVGPAGFAVTSTPFFADIRTVFDYTMVGRASTMGGRDDPDRVGRVVKDGFELRLNEPRFGMTLWDLSQDEAVYVLGPEVVETGGVPPDGVRELGRGESYTLVFEDPDTGLDLVTFTMWDLLKMFGMDDVHETWVGWSADGIDWEWQRAVDAFGIDAEVRLAVGDDFVLAYMTAGVEPPRWFIASVPAS